MITFVPARGGSKGLPGKNIRPLAGVPLIVHTLKCAVEAESVSRVIVTTDDADIREVSLSIAGIEAPFLRPAGLAGDDASAIDVYLHAVDWVSVNEGIIVESFCVLLPTSPMRLPKDVDAAIALYGQMNADVVVSVCESKPLGFHQNIEKDGQLVPIEGVPTSMANRQMLAPTVVLNGAIYVLNAAKFRQTRSYFGQRSYGYKMPTERSIDIDDAADLAIAEALIKGQNDGSISAEEVSET